MSQRPFKPTALKLIEGERNKDRIPQNEPKPRPIKPYQPKGLDANAKKVWKRLSPILCRLGLLTEADSDNFASLCQNISRLEMIREMINKMNGKILMIKHTVDGAGNEHIEAKTNPLMVEERMRMEILRSQAQEFGLTPRGRMGLVVGSGKVNPDGMEDLLD